MTGALLVALLLAPGAGREPVGGPDAERIEDPLARKVASLLAGEPVTSGVAAIMPLYARVPSEAGEGRPAEIRWATKGLSARVLVEDGRFYLRVVNPAKTPALLPAGAVFAGDGIEVAAARHAVIPPDYTALVPAAAVFGDETGDLVFAGELPPQATGALLAGLPAFMAEMDAFVVRGEERYVPVLATGTVRSRRDALAALLKPIVGGFGGTMVGAVFVVGDRPVAARIFARHDLFVDALPDVLLGFAVAVRDEEMGAAARSRAVPAAETRSRALGWLRTVARARAPWTESYGAGFETLFTTTTPPAVAGHAVVDQQRALVHATFYAIRLVPTGQPGVDGPTLPPTPPDNPGETPTGFRDRRPRPTVEDERRKDQNPNPGPHGDAPKSPGAGVGQGQPDRTPPPR